MRLSRSVILEVPEGAARAASGVLSPLAPAVSDGTHHQPITAILSIHASAHIISQRDGPSDVTSLRGSTKGNQTRTRSKEQYSCTEQYNDRRARSKVQKAESCVERDFCIATHLVQESEARHRFLLPQAQAVQSTRQFRGLSRANR